MLVGKRRFAIWIMLFFCFCFFPLFVCPHRRCFVGIVNNFGRLCARRVGPPEELLPVWGVQGVLQVHLGRADKQCRAGKKGQFNWFLPHSSRQCDNVYVNQHSQYTLWLFIAFKILLFLKYFFLWHFRVSTMPFVRRKRNWDIQKRI